MLRYLKLDKQASICEQGGQCLIGKLPLENDVTFCIFKHKTKIT